jgi:hypothetical protein
VGAKALVVSDLQAAEGPERLRANPAVPLQRWRVQRCYADLAALFREHGCRYLIDLGDTTDDRHAVPVPTLTTVLAGLAEIRPDPLLSFKLIGNHEQALQRPDLHPGGAYRGYHHVVDDRAVVLVGDVAVVAVACLRADGYRTLLLGHLQVNGATNRGHTLRGLDLADVDLALLGHVHEPQEVRPNVHYVGSPFQQDFGELGQVKRVGLLDLETLGLRWLALPGRYPRYLKLTLPELESYGELGEDRVVVTLRSAAEAARFYAHPLARHVEPDYALAPEAGTAEPATWGDHGALLARYVREHPLPGVAEDELLAAGRELVA